MLTKEELAEIFSKLPQNLQKILVKDMLNAGRIQKINDTVAKMAAMNGGENMEKFFEALKPLLNGQKWNRQTFKEPVKQAMRISNMLPQHTINEGLEHDAELIWRENELENKLNWEQVNAHPDEFEPDFATCDFNGWHFYTTEYSDYIEFTAPNGKSGEFLK